MGIGEVSVMPGSMSEITRKRLGKYYYHVTKVVRSQNC